MKKKVLVLILSILAVLLCITACSRDDDGENNDDLVKSIEVIQGTYPVSCEVGETPDFSGLKVKIHFHDGTTHEIGSSEVQISAVDTSTAGKKTVTVTYNGKSASFEFTVNEKPEPVAVITGIKIVPGSAPSTALLAKPYEKEGLQVEATYSDGTKKMLTETFTVSDIDTSTTGEKTLTVTYGEFSTSMTVTVLGIKEMYVKAGTIVDMVFVGESLDDSNLTLSVKYADDTIGDIPRSALTVGSINNKEIGKQKLKISYLGYTMDFEVEVYGPQTLEVLGGSVVTSVMVKGTAPDVSNIKATLKYSSADIEPKELEAKDLTVTNISTATAGKQLLKVSYTEKGVTVEATVEITVIGVKSIIVRDGTIAKKINVGDTLNKDNLEIIVTYTNDKTETISYPNANLTVGTISTEAYGIKELNIKYLDSETIKYPIEVVGPTGIKVKPGTVATSVMVKGDAPDVSGIAATLHYSDGTTDDLKTSDLTVTNISTAEAGKKMLTVKYGDFEDKVEINVVGVQSMELVQSSIKNEVIPGKTLDTTDISVKVTYTDGSNDWLTEAELNLVDDGNGTLTIDYLDAETITHTYRICQIVGIYVEGVDPTVPAGTLPVLTQMNVYGVYNDSNGTHTDAPLPKADINTNIADFEVDYQGEKTDLVIIYEGEYGRFEKKISISATAPLFVGVKIVGYEKKVPIKEAYAIGSSYSVYAIYSNDYEKPLRGEELNAVVIGTVDTSVAKNNATLTVSYTENGVTKSTTVEDIKVLPLKSLTISGLQSGLVVDKGDAFDISGMTVYAEFSDGVDTISRYDVTAKVTVTNPGTANGGDQTLKVEYGEKDASYTYHVKAINGIEIVGGTLPEKIAAIDSEIPGLQVKITYTYGAPKTVLASTLGDIVSINGGNVTVTYKPYADVAAFTATKTVKVLPLTGLAITDIRENKVDKGGYLDVSGAKVIAYFYDGVTTFVRDVTSLVGGVPGADTSTGGDKELVVTYGNQTAKFQYHVKAVASIEIFSGYPSFLLNVNAGSYDNLKIKIKYTDGTESIVLVNTLANATLTKPSEGNLKVSVSYKPYNDLPAFTDSKEINVIVIASVNGLNGTIPREMLEGANKDALLSQIKLTVIGQNGKAYLVGLDDPNFVITNWEDFNTSVPGEYGLELKYIGAPVVSPLGAPIDLGETTVNITVKGVAKDEHGNRKLNVVEGTVPNEIPVGKQLNTSGLQIYVEFTDGTYKYVKAGESGLAIGTIDYTTEGTKYLPVTYMGLEFTYAIQVKSYNTGGGLIFGALLPDQLVQRESYKKNFKDNNNGYIVGDDNPFIFYLDVVVLDDNDKVIDTNGRYEPTKVTVKENDVALSGAALDSVVSFPGVNEYQFKPAAIGRTFTLEIYPTEYMGDNLASVTKSLTVTVVDGYNVYNAWELNLMTNNNDKVYEAHTLTQNGLVDKYLAEKHPGATRPTNLSALIIHNNLYVTLADLPSEYTIDCELGGGKEFYDKFGLFCRFMNPGETFSIYGNYYSIYSYNLPCIGHAEDPIDKEPLGSNFSFFRVRGDNSTSLAKTLRTNALADSSYIPYKDITFNVEDLAMRDNDPNSNDQSASERHIRGSNAFFVGRNTTNLTNVNVDAFMVSVNVEGGNSWLNLTNSKLYNAWQGHLFLWSSNYYQKNADGEKQETWAEVRPVTVDIKDSFLAKCGGPVILAMNADRDMNVSKCNANMGVNVQTDNNSTLYSYVTGQEAWFVAMNQTQLAASILTMNQLVTGTANGMRELGYGAFVAKDSFLSDKKITGVDTVNMVMVNLGTNPAALISGTEEYSGSYKVGDNYVMAQKASYNTDVNQPGNTLYNSYVGTATIHNPIFESSAHGMAYADMGNLLAGLKMLSQNDQMTFFQGDNLTLYYKGISIVMQYYPEIED